MKMKSTILLGLCLSAPVAMAMPSSGMFLTAGVGFLSANPAKTNVLAFGNSGLNYRYQALTGRHTAMTYGFGVGYRTPISDSFLWKISVNYLNVGNYHQTGATYDETDTKFFDYDYNITSQAVLLRDDFQYMSQDDNSLWHNLNPFLGFTVGYASNTSEDYRQNQYVSHTYFPNKTSGHFAFGFDAGLAFEFNDHNDISLDLQYLNLGNSTLGDYQNHELSSENISGLAGKLAYSYYF